MNSVILNSDEYVKTKCNVLRDFRATNFMLSYQEIRGDLI